MEPVWSAIGQTIATISRRHHQCPQKFAVPHILTNILVKSVIDCCHRHRSDDDSNFDGRPGLLWKEGQGHWWGKGQ